MDRNVSSRLTHEYGYRPPITDEGGRFKITGLDPASARLELSALPKPGQPYLMAEVAAGRASDVVLECARGIPFRLNVVDEAGTAVESDVEYTPVSPNPYLTDVLQGIRYDGTFPFVRAARISKGTYEGVVIPGPGAVIVKTPGRSDYRPAHADPKLFFAPGKTDWSDQDLISAYGTNDTLMVGIGAAWVDQHDYAAIVLVKPPVGSKPLELSTTVVRDRPRQVTILDPAGAPVVGVETRGLTAFPWDNEPPPRAATFPVTKLHPNRSRRITFVKEDRGLIGFLLARGDGEAPYTVTLQPWATVLGRIRDENGEPLPPLERSAAANAPAVMLSTSQRLKLAIQDDATAGECPDSQSDSQGRFRIERLIPGLRYSCQIYRNRGVLAGFAFENLVLKPGETRDLGDIRWKTPAD